MRKSPPTHRSGPVRSERARQAILEATAALFLEYGYGKLAIEGVAAKASVGKQTIYRWWKSKGALISDCLLEGLIFPKELSIDNTGDIRTDLVDWLMSVTQTLEPINGDNTLLALAAAAAENPQIGMRLRDTVLQRQTLSMRLAAATGQTTNLYPGAPFDDIAEAIVGTLVLKVLGRANLDIDTASRIVTATIGSPVTPGAQ